MVVVVFVFFFKQKTAYEMRISDWSSDVCSSDLAHAIALQCVAVVFMVPLGIGQAAVVRVGLAAGARDGEGVRRAGWSALLASTLFMACSALAFWFAGRFLVGLFLDPAMPENAPVIDLRSEEHTSELPSLIRISYAVFC